MTRIQSHKISSPRHTDPSRNSVSDSQIIKTLSSDMQERCMVVLRYVKGPALSFVCMQAKLEAQERRRRQSDGIELRSCLRRLPA